MDFDEPTYVPPGEYLLVYDFHEPRFMFHVWKLYMQFKICDDADNAGKPLTRYYNIDYVAGLDNVRKIRAGWHSDLMREFVSLFGEKPRRVDEIPLTRFRGREFIGIVENVTKDQHGYAIPESLRYSKIVKLLRVVV